MTAPADKGKKAKTEAGGGEENEQIDGALVLSIEKLQEIQDELEKVSRKPVLPLPLLFLGFPCCCVVGTVGFGSGVCVGAWGCVEFGRDRSGCGIVEFSGN